MILTDLHTHCLTLAPTRSEATVETAATSDPTAVQCEVWLIDSGRPQLTLGEADQVFRQELAKMAAEGDHPALWMILPKAYDTPEGIVITALVAVRGKRLVVHEFLMP